MSARFFVTAILIIGAIAVVVYLMTKADEGLEKATGADLSEWGGRLWGVVLFGAVGGGGIMLIVWGVNIDNPIPIILGFALTAFGGWSAWASLIGRLK